MYVGSFNYFAFAIHMGSNCYIKTGVRDFEVALFKTNQILLEEMTLSEQIYYKSLCVAEINTQLLDRILHSTFLQNELGDPPIFLPF